MVMKTSWAILLAFCVVAGGVVLGISTRQQQESRIPLDRAIERGLAYLNSVYTPFRYPDPYLEYRYPGEALACPLEGCTLTYRILDAFFDVAFLEQELADPDLLGKQRIDAQNAFTAILPEWRAANLYNTITGEGKNGVALDTACILGFATHDRGIAEHVGSFLTDDGNWMRDDSFATDAWRNIADETWCIRLFLRTQVGRDRVVALIEKKIAETEEFLAHTSSANDRIAVLYHMAILLAEQNDPQQRERLDGYVRALAAFATQSDIRQDTFMLANILDALVRSGRGDPSILRSIADALRMRQREDGSWVKSARDPSYPVFTTFRVLLGLNQYRRSQPAAATRGGT
jgi:hypothetical protein